MCYDVVPGCTVDVVDVVDGVVVVVVVAVVFFVDVYVMCDDGDVVVILRSSWML